MRLLAVSIGNSSIRVGRFSGDRLVKATSLLRTSAALGKEWKALTQGATDRVVLASVVPTLARPMAALLRSQTGLKVEQLTPTSDHGLKLAYREPRRLGVDRLAAALGAQTRFPDRSLIVVDFGTATTLTAIRRDGTLLGGAILPGAELAAGSLVAGTAQLPEVSPGRPRRATGKSPEEAIQSGVFFGQVGAVRELTARLKTEALAGERVTVIGTGGQAPLFKQEKLFTVYEPNLILLGLHAFAIRHSDHA